MAGSETPTYGMDTCEMNDTSDNLYDLESRNIMQREACRVNEELWWAYHYQITEESFWSYTITLEKAGGQSVTLEVRSEVWGIEIVNNYIIDTLTGTWDKFDSEAFLNNNTILLGNSLDWSDAVPTTLYDEADLERIVYQWTETLWKII